MLHAIDGTDEPTRTIITIEIQYFNLQANWGRAPPPDSRSQRPPDGAPTAKLRVRTPASRPNPATLVIVSVKMRPSTGSVPTTDGPVPDRLQADC